MCVCVCVCVCVFVCVCVCILGVGLMGGPGGCTPLLASCQRWTKTQVPAEIRWVIRTIRQRARARFGTDDVAGARAFLFLRYFCAAVVAPESFDLIDSPPTSVARRALVLVSKVLQVCCVCVCVCVLCVVCWRGGYSI